MSKQKNNSLAELPVGFRMVEVSREPIELFKILKFEGLVGSGGEAKVAIASGLVLLNREIETQKRKKIVSGDTIEFGEEKIFIKLSPFTSDNDSPQKIEVKPTVKKKLTRRKAIPVLSKK